MTFIKKYWPFIAIVVVAVLVWILKPNPNNELKKQFLKERKELMNQNDVSEKRIESLIKDSISVRLKMRNDAAISKIKDGQDKINNERFKKRSDEITYKDYSDATLDSTRKRILSNY